MRYPYNLSNEADCERAIQEIEAERKRELGADEGAVRSLHNTQVSLTGFMSANPNAQIAFAEQNGFFPQTGNNPYEE